MRLDRQNVARAAARTMLSACTACAGAGASWGNEVFIDLGGPATGFVALHNAKNSTSETGISGRDANGEIIPNHNGLPDYPYFEIPGGPISGSGAWTSLIVSPQSTANDYSVIGDAFFGGAQPDILQQIITQTDAETLSAGRLNFDASALTGVGMETVPVSALSFDLNTFEYDGQVRPEVTGDPRSNFPAGGGSLPPIMISPFSPAPTPYNDGSGAGNAQFVYEMFVDNLTGDGLTLMDGQLESLDVRGDVRVEAYSPAAFFFGRAVVEGEVALSGTGYAFDIADTGGTGPISAANFFMNRAGTASLVGTIGSPGLAGDYNASGSVEQGDLDLVLTNWGGPRGFQDGVTGFSTANVDQEELDLVLTNWGSSAIPSLSDASVVPEPGAFALLVLTSGILAACRREATR